MALSDLDRGLIKDCIEGDPQAWKNFCDRFAGLVMDVVEDTVVFARGSADNSTLQLASTGHSATQASQSMHSSGWM